MPATDYNDLPKYKQDKRLEMLGESVGISRSDYSQWDPESTSRGYGKKGDYDDFEKDVIRAINNDYDYRTAMQYSDDAPKAVNNASEALNVYRMLKGAHKDMGNNNNSFSSPNDFGNAAKHIFEQNRSAFADSIGPKKGGGDKQQKPAAPKTPAKTVLSKQAREANAFVDAHNAMTLGNASPLQGMSVSNKAGTYSPEAADFKESFQLKLGGQLNLGGSGSPLTFTEAITGTKPTAAAPLMSKFKENIKGQLEPK
jgi:hypothetical protein